MKKLKAKWLQNATKNHCNELIFYKRFIQFFRCFNILSVFRLNSFYLDSFISDGQIVFKSIIS